MPLRRRPHTLAVTADHVHRAIRERRKHRVRTWNECRHRRQTVPSRRDFLKGAAAAGAGVVVGSVGGAAGAAPEAVAAHRRSRRAATRRQRRRAGEQRRLRPDLPGAAAVRRRDRHGARRAARGRAAGRDPRRPATTSAAGPKALIVDPTVNGNPTTTNPYGTNPDNPTMTAGSTFVGQFTDHDITFDQTSQLGVPQNPLISPNTRTPALDLDSVFGGGPGLRPDLYVDNPDGSVGPKLKIGTGGVHEDVPRVANGDGTYTRAARRPAQRRERRCIAGLHCAHILFYNRVLDELAELDLRALPVRAAAAELANALRRVPDRPPGDPVALPVAAGQRAPAADRRPGGRRRRAAAAATASTRRRRGRVHADRVRRRRLPLRPQHGAPLLPGQLHQRHRRQHQPDRGPVLRAGLRPERAGLLRPGQLRPRRPARRLSRRRGATSAGRRSSTSATARSRTTRRSTRRSRASCSRCRCRRSRRTPRRAPTVLPQRNLLRQLTWGLPSGQAVARAMGVHALDAERPRRHRRRLRAVRHAARRSGTTSSPRPRRPPTGCNLGPGRRADRHRDADRPAARRPDQLPQRLPALPAVPRAPTCSSGSNPDPNITGNRTYTRAHFLYYAGVVTPGHLPLRCADQSAHFRAFGAQHSVGVLISRLHSRPEVDRNRGRWPPWGGVRARPSVV